jgi:alkyl sulfatase BDS1-like metallo-beta-lactamase superfamily hydrolase
LSCFSAALAVLLVCALAAFAAGSAGLFDSKPPTEATKRFNAEYKKAPLNYTDDHDADWARRGLIARGSGKVTKEDGTVVWDMSRYSYISGDISKPGEFPDTVNPSLWRQAILNAEYGLYEVTSHDFGGDIRRIWQVRGYDLAHMTFVETQNGFIVVDVTSYRESAKAAVDLFYENLPQEKRGKKIHTIIYTHSHVDHYGGVLGVLEDSASHTEASVEIVAPDGFMDAAVSENVTAGGAMSQRARSMYGALLWHPALSIPEGRGQVNNGLAIGSGNGTSGLMPPTTIIASDGSKTFDGTAVDFLLAPHTEAPAEMTMLFSDYRSLCLAEICNQTQHNILTPRGAEVRDTIAWSGALGKMKTRWIDAGLVDSAWGPHTWPRWGKADIAEYVGKQSRLYRYIHDQTVYLMNKGYDMEEIAEVFKLPEDLAKEWFNRGYYGDLRFNVKAVYQKYLGWFDGNAATLWKLPEKEAAALWAKYLPRSGGDLVQAARSAYSDGQYRWVAEVLENVRLAPDSWGSDKYDQAAALQADAFEQMAYGAESGIWRNFFLTAAWRNRDKTAAALLDSPVSVTMGPDTVSNMTTLDILETLSTQINCFTDASAFGGMALWMVENGDGTEEQYMSRMEDHVLWTGSAAGTGTEDVKITLARAALNAALEQATLQISWMDALLADPDVKIEGDREFLTSLAALTHIDPPALPSDGATPVNPDPIDPSPDDPPVPPIPSSTEIANIRLVLPDGSEYSAERQPSGAFFSLLPEGTNLTNLTLSFDLPNGAISEPPAGTPHDFSRGPVSLTATYGSAKKIYMVSAAAPSLVTGALTETSPDMWALNAKWNTEANDGSYIVNVDAMLETVEIPTGFIYVTGKGLDAIELSILSGDALNSQLPQRGYRLRIAGKTASREYVEDVEIVSVVWQSAQNTNIYYVQTFDPPKGHTEITHWRVEPEPFESGGGGCDTGAGALLLTGMVLTRVKNTGGKSRKNKPPRFWRFFGKHRTRHKEEPVKE